MIKLQVHYIRHALLLVFVIAMSACSSDSETQGVMNATSGSGARAATDTTATNALMFNTPEYQLTQEFPMEMEVSSSVFSRIRRIPIEYTCVENYYYPEAASTFRYGEDKSPPLAWSNVPDGTKSFVLISDDPDAIEHEVGVISPRVHWLIWNIPSDITELPEHIATTTDARSVGPNTRQGINDFKVNGWSGPCPPPNIVSISKRNNPQFGYTAKVQQPHQYMFKIYALDTVDFP